MAFRFSPSYWRIVLGLCCMFSLVHTAVSTPPEDPVICVSGDTDCRVTNSYGVFPDRSTCRAANVAYPTTEAERVSIVAAATKARRKMRVTTRYSHSIPKLACSDGTDGLFISTKFLNHKVRADAKAMTLTVESGVTLKQLIAEAAKVGLALPYAPYWWGLTVGGMMGTGAHGSSLWGKGSAVHDYVTEIRMVSPGSVNDGFAKVRVLNESATPVEFNAAKVSLGVLGVISQVSYTMDPAAAAAAEQVPAPVVFDAHYVGKAFVMQYYEILHNKPHLLHHFYQEISKVGRVGEDGVMRDFSTLDGIREELDTLSFGDFKSAKITSFHTQESYNGGYILMVIGCFTLKEGLKRKFTQTFFLAPQVNGFYVLNDILRFDNEPDDLDGEDSETSCRITAPTGGIQGSEQAACVSENPVVCKEVSKPLTDENASVAEDSNVEPDYVNEEVPHIQGSEQAACVSENPVVCKEMSKPLTNENASVAKDSNVEPDYVNEEVPHVEITSKKVDGDSVKVSVPDNEHGNVSKKSYASVVAKEKTVASAGSSLSPKQKPKDQEHQVTSDVSTEQILKDQGHQMSSDPFPVEKSDAVSDPVDATEYGHNQGFEAVAEGTSIYVRHLPANANVNMLETEFKKFGAIGSGGIQVVSQRGFGYPYGFVEFKDADAAQKAMEASPLIIGGQKAFVEEKRSTARGNRGSGYGNRNVGGSGGNEYGNRNVGGTGGNESESGGYGNRNVGGRGGRYGYGNNYYRGRGGGKMVF